MAGTLYIFLERHEKSSDISLANGLIYLRLRKDEASCVARDLCNLSDQSWVTLGAVLLTMQYCKLLPALIESFQIAGLGANGYISAILGYLGITESNQKSNVSDIRQVRACFRCMNCKEFGCAHTWDASS